MRQGVAVDVKHDGRLIDAFFYAPGWNPREMPLTNVQRFRYGGAPFPAYAYPLEPGKSWYTIVDALDPATGRTHRVHVQGKVIGWERIRVPAGEFDVLRVRRFVFADNAEFFKTQEEIIQTDWYAPSVRRVVREEGTSRHVDRSRSDGRRRRWHAVGRERRLVDRRARRLLGSLTRAGRIRSACSSSTMRSRPIAPLACQRRL